MKDNCFNEYDPSAIDVNQAISKIKKTIKSVKSHELVRIKDSIGRVLAKNIKSTLNVPNYKNSAMDGYAISMKDINSNINEFEHVGDSFAGHSYEKNLKANQTVKVMTGGKVPKNCNAVVMQEMTSKKNNKIIIKSKVSHNQNIRFPGEDIKKGSLLLKAGKVINEIDIGLLASIGISEVPVINKPIIGFFSTGDELVSINKKLRDSEVYDSNRYLLHGLLKKFPVIIKDYGLAKDKRSTIEKKLKIARRECHMLLTTGGVSVGDADFVKDALEKLGKINFWKISVKPGRPLAYGSLGKCIFFGLPGNPVSVAVTFSLFVESAIRKLISQENEEKLYLFAKLVGKIKKRKGRKEYKRGILTIKNGKYIVKTTGKQGSNILSSLKDANCFIELDENVKEVADGQAVKTIPLNLQSKEYE